MRRIILVALLCATTLHPALSQSRPALKGTVERIKVHGASLQGNLEGDSPDRDVSIYLPPSYRTDTQRRYPVLYLLHGFTDRDDLWFSAPTHFVNVPMSVEKALAAGTAREMVIVMPNAFTRYAGSFYGSSVATGDWETFVTRELVTYVDGHYRTIARRESRGLAGHSMGGYGTIRLAMKQPDVYAGVYAMSACCLTPSRTTPAAVAKMQSVKTDDDFNKADFLTKLGFAFAASWSANPKAARFIDLPYTDTIPQPAVAAAWTANAPTAMLGQYVASLKQIRFIAFDVGLQDGLVADNRVLDRLLTDYSIAHTFETYEGDHVNKIAERLETRVLPYFTRILSFEPASERP
jgi:S-formylglutathione hydrolase